MSSHTLYETLVGQIHSFILPTLLTEGTKPPLSIFIRRIVHYMHSAYVMNDSSDGSHLLRLSSLDDARDLFSLISMAIFLNVLDERTYRLSLESPQERLPTLQQCHELFDLNAIPVIERHHLCYVRGLSFDLLEWFFENYSFSSLELEEDDIDALSTIFIPFIVRIGRQIAKYKRVAEEHGYTTLSTFNAVNRQVQSALFSFEAARDAWLEEKAAEEEEEHCRDMDDNDTDEMDIRDLEYDFGDYIINQREIAMKRNHRDNFLEEGKSIADKRFFHGLASQFNLEEHGEILVSNYLWFYF